MRQSLIFNVSTIDDQIIAVSFDGSKRWRTRVSHSHQPIIHAYYLVLHLFMVIFTIMLLHNTCTSYTLSTNELLRRTDGPSGRSGRTNEQTNETDERYSVSLERERRSYALRMVMVVDDGVVERREFTFVCIHKNTPIPYVCPLNEYDKYKMMYELGLVSEEIYINCNSVLLSIKYRYLLA